jgi:hypothetical protein
MKFLFKPTVVMGIGLGIMMTCITIMILKNSVYSDYEIEKKARELGMKYPDEIRALEQ